MTEQKPSRPAPLFTSFWFLAGALTMLRVLVLILTDANLGPDEAQYWFWSQEPAFGYFSKPPMIAWAIALTTGVFGDATWAVRLSAPLFHFGVASFLYLLGRNIFDQRTAFWSAIGWITIPGVILSSFLMTTDAPLLFFWSGALYFFFKILHAHDKQQDTLRYSVLLGLMIGAALMSKYAALYFAAAMAIAVISNKRVRAALLWRNAAIIMTTAVIIFVPNILWNVENDFQTIAHTAANANWGAALFKPFKLFAFWGAQFGVFGVILFGALLWAAASLLKPSRREKYCSDAHLLLIFTLAPLVIVSLQAFISRAHANWAAAAFPSGILLVTYWLLKTRTAWTVKLSAGFHGVLALLFMAGVLNFGLIDQLGLSKTVRDLRGWQTQSLEIAALAGGYDAVMTDDRSLAGEMLYYLRDKPIEIIAWDPNARIDNHYEAFHAFDFTRHKNVLFVTTQTDDAHVNYRFKTITPLGAVTVAPGGVTRSYHLFALSDYYGSF